MKKPHTNWKEASVLSKTMLSIAFFLTMWASHAQTSEKKITLTCDKVPFEKALQRLAQQAGVFFAYSINFADANRPVSFSVQNESLERVMARVCSQMGLEFKQQGKHFILRKKAPAAAKVPVKKPATIAKASPPPVKPTPAVAPTPKKDTLPAITSGPAKETARDPKRDSLETVADSLLAASDSVDSDTMLVFELDKPVMKSDTAIDSVLVFLFNKSTKPRRIITPTRIYTYHPHPFPRIRTGADLERFLFGTRNYNESDTLQADSLQNQNQQTTKNVAATNGRNVQAKRTTPQYSKAFRKWRPNEYGFMVRPGIYVNEVTYLGAEVQVGTQSVYGIANFGLTNNGIKRLGFGAGFALPIARSWSMGADFTMAKVHKEYTYDNPGPEPPIQLRLNSWHDRLQVNLHWQATRRLQFTFGPSFNWLITRYQANRERLAVLVKTDPYVPVEFIKELRFLSYGTSVNTINPPYRLRNSYSNLNLEYGILDSKRITLIEYFRNTKTWIGGQIGVYYTIGAARRR